MAGCPIRRSSDQCSVPAPRCFSQLPTSFFGTRRQGIHRMPLFLLALIPRLCNHRSGCSSHTITTPLHHSAKHGSVFRCHSVSLKQHLPAPTMRSAGSMHPSVGLVVCSLQLVRCKTRLHRETDLWLDPRRSSPVVYHPLHLSARGRALCCVPPPGKDQTILSMVEMRGVEPRTSCVQSRRSSS